MSYPWLSAAIAAYQPRPETYGSTFKMISQKLLETEPRCLYRDAFDPGHFTASAWIVNPQRTHTHLIEHPVSKAIMQSGGHADGDENLLEVAIKEAIEEIGFTRDQMYLPLGDAIFHMDVHSIAERTRKGVIEPRHFHYDVRFLIEVDHTLPLPPSPEGIPTRWFSNEEAEALFPKNLGRWQMLDMARRA